MTRKHVSNSTEICMCHPFPQPSEGLEVEYRCRGLLFLLPTGVRDNTRRSFSHEIQKVYANQETSIFTSLPLNSWLSCSQLGDISLPSLAFLKRIKKDIHKACNQAMQIKLTIVNIYMRFGFICKPLVKSHIKILKTFGKLGALCKNKIRSMYIIFRH